MAETKIVIPCYNEAQRLRVDAFQQFMSRHHDIHFLFVDDGSTDDTTTVLQRLRESHPESCEVCTLPKNVGKAEAVRRGFLQTFQTDARFVGLWDADLAAPLDAIPTFCDILRSSKDHQIVFGSRVRMLGRDVRRSAVRHYSGRVFATVVSLMLRLPVYDTQCGAKLFRTSSIVEEIFREPFVARWIFDVEIIARLIRSVGTGGSTGARHLIYEYPLPVWHDVRGSKVRVRDYVRAALDVLRIHRRYFVR